ncbi:MAG TPA: hypothetical protein DIT04_14170 [Dysgonomonas sp.]|nr:hypothetical protein [Dysgonomonas sp.]
MLDYFLQKSIKSGFKRYRRNSCFLNYNDIKAVLVFFEMEEWESVKPILEELRAEGKRVAAWTVKKESGKKISFPYYVRVLDTRVEINWMRMLTPEVLAEFDRIEYDTLMDFTYTENDYILYLLSRNKSRFCIGTMEREYKVYDFIMLRDRETGIDLYDLYWEMKNYLLQIQ